jgi:aerobic carbon-monoxide dehydrogenase medium subunit
MKPSPFSYHAPATTDDLLALAAEHAASGRVLAGGQSLMPLLNARRVRVEHLIDMNGVAGLDRLELDDGVLAIGALVRQARALADPTTAEAAPLLAEALDGFASPSVRSRGTICGNIAFAQPAAELPAVALALGGEVVARHAGGERRIEIEDFFVGPYTTALRPGEVICELRLRRRPAGMGHGFASVRRMHFPVVSAAAVVVCDGGTVSRCAVALAGVGETPVRATVAEDALAGAEPSEEAIAQAALAAGEGLDISGDDVLATASYRSHVAGVLIRRALTAAAERATTAMEAGR